VVGVILGWLLLGMLVAHILITILNDRETARKLKLNAIEIEGLSDQIRRNQKQLVADAEMLTRHREFHQTLLREREVLQEWFGRFALGLSLPAYATEAEIMKAIEDHRIEYFKLLGERDRLKIER
jgi:hypothetical protein